jgi:hypothetical protein
MGTTLTDTQHGRPFAATDIGSTIRISDTRPWPWLVRVAARLCRWRLPDERYCFYHVTTVVSAPEAVVEAIRTPGTPTETWTGKIEGNIFYNRSTYYPDA